MALLDVEDLHVRYGEVAALHGLSLQIAEGELVAVLGANGAGKTTLLRAISGLLHSARGHIRFLGKDLRNVAPHEVVALGLRHVPEGRGLLGDLTVAENLRLGRYLRGLRATEEDLEKVLELFPILRERYGQLAALLSGGEQQMLSIARGLVGRPKLIMIDELSLGLAPKIATELMHVLARSRDTGLAVLMVEQSAHQALKFAERVYVLANGTIALEGNAAAMANNPAVIQAYLGRD